MHISNIEIHVKITLPFELQKRIDQRKNAVLFIHVKRGPYFLPDPLIKIISYQTLSHSFYVRQLVNPDKYDQINLCFIFILMYNYYLSNLLRRTLGLEWAVSNEHLITNGQPIKICRNLKSVQNVKILRRSFSCCIGASNHIITLTFLFVCFSKIQKMKENVKNGKTESE